MNEYQIPSVDFADLAGNEHVKRALEVAVAGRHPILLTGPRGVGKSTYARAAASLLPTGTPCITVPKMVSKAELIELKGYAGLLIVDDLPEHRKTNLDWIAFWAENGHLAGPLLIGTLSPCPCGFYGDVAHACTCTASQVLAYRARYTLKDVFVVNIEVTPVSDDKRRRFQEYRQHQERSATLVDRVDKAQRISHTRGVDANHLLDQAAVNEYCNLDTAGQSLMKAAVRQLALTNRQIFNMLKVARTVADLAGARNIEPVHLAESLQYR